VKRYKKYYHFTIFFCIFKSFHYSTYLSFIISISFHYFFRIFQIFSPFDLPFFHIFQIIWLFSSMFSLFSHYFLLYFPKIFTIQPTFLPYFLYHGRKVSWNVKWYENMEEK
jgi:hypothetical protein